MDITIENSTELGVGIYELMKKTIYKVQKKRLKKFLRCVDLRYEYMTLLEQAELNKKINTEEGQEILANFAESILKTTSDRVCMATALLYCEDRDFNFDDTEKITLISAMKELNDDILDFFLETANLSRQEVRTPYPRAGINKQNFERFSKKRWDKEAVFVYVNDLIRLRLLLPDPASSVGAGEGSGQDWSASFGITNRSLKMISLFRKSEELLIEA
ncbi:hypothetical protein [Marinomonas sp. PE14-40]|uniref:hypothetical protein n=1 Tax=Marinomonas sp. PE14-40 TaxID=3060621 RepID=UPI003F67E1A7